MTTGVEKKKQKQKRIDQWQLERQIASTRSRFQTFQLALVLSFVVIFAKLA